MDWVGIIGYIVLMVFFVSLEVYVTVEKRKLKKEMEAKERIKVLLYGS